MRRRNRVADQALRALSKGGDEATRKASVEPLSDFAFSVGIRVGRPPRAQIDAVFSALGRLATTEPARLVRLEAIYALSHWHEPRAARPLLAVFSDATLDAELRGRAAEGLGWILGVERGSAELRRAAADALITGLQHPDATVRFWAVYALGHMQAKAARPELERLARTDEAVCPGMWSVGDEARDVLSFWEGKGWGAERETGPESRRIVT